MPTEDKLHARAEPSAAILVRIEQSIYRQRCIEIFNAVKGAVEAHDTPEAYCTPLWLKFDSVDGSKFAYPAPVGYAPNSKEWLDGLVLAIPETARYTRVRRFDIAEMTGQKPKAPRTSAPVVVQPYFNDRLPHHLQFLRSDNAFRECQSLAAVLRSFPRVGKSSDENAAEMEQVIVSMSETYPNLDRANKLMRGQLRKAMRLIGRHAGLRLGSFDMFMSSLRLGAFHALEDEADSMEIGVQRWYHNDDGTRRDMAKFLGAGQGHDSLIGANLSPVQDMTDESLEYGELRSIVTTNWIGRRNDAIERSAPAAVGSASKEIRPPSIPEAIWDQVPYERRREAVVAAAKGLRRGVHPEHTMTPLLESWGVAVSDTSIALD